MSKSKSKNSKTSPILTAIVALPLIGALLGVTTVMVSQRTAQAADVVVYKSPTCGCCKKWISHLEQNGYMVEVRNQRNLTSIKAEAGVPRQLQSCHTAKVGGYVVEGHVPADVITRLLEEKPQVKGLAVPGMPMGSPGMEGPRKDAYDIISFRGDGKTSVYASR